MTASRDIQATPAVLSLSGLRVWFDREGSKKQVIDALGFDLKAGEIVGLAGESGCGKSMTALALMGLLPAGARCRFDHCMLGGDPVFPGDERRMRPHRGRDVSMVFQEPQTALDPVLTIGNQLTAVIRRIDGLGRTQARGKALEALESTGIADAERILNSYPHQLSGGMRQRILIAMALTGQPRVLLADEPTTALDVTTQAQVLNLLTGLGRRLGTAVLLITHDLGIVAQYCDRVMVMADGRIVESGRVGELFASPKQELTRRLLDAVPRLDSPLPPTSGTDRNGENLPALLSIRQLDVDYALPGRSARRLAAVKSVSMQIEPGMIYGLVGESGSGKTSVARAICRLIEPAGGSIEFRGQQLLRTGAATTAEHRKDIQLVFQDPYASLSPRRSIGQSLREPLDHFRIDQPSQRPGLIRSALREVGLDEEILDRFPNELSGGQRQRVALARALVCDPQLIVADEAVSSLDVSVQARIIELILRLREENGIAFLFISHDLAVVRQLADVVGVMVLGELVESAPARILFEDPVHPYTRALLRAVPQPDPAAPMPVFLQGEPPSPLTPPPGCVFHTRCAEQFDLCKTDKPETTMVKEKAGNAPPHLARCHLCSS